MINCLHLETNSCYTMISRMKGLFEASKLSGALWQRVGKRRASNYVSGIRILPPIPCGPLSTGLSDFRQSARSGNERECKQTLKNTCQG